VQYLAMAKFSVGRQGLHSNVM